MTTPIYDQVTAIRNWTEANRRARREYSTHPFAATHVCKCPGDCGGYVTTNGNNTTDFCIPCANKHHNPLPPLRKRPPPPPQRDTCLHCNTPLKKKQRRYCSRGCAMRHHCGQKDTP